MRGLLLALQIQSLSVKQHLSPGGKVGPVSPGDRGDLLQIFKGQRGEGNGLSVPAEADQADRHGFDSHRP